MWRQRWESVGTLTAIHFLPRCIECKVLFTTSKMPVRLSVYQTRALWQNERNVCLLSYIELKILVLRQEEWLVGATPSTWNFSSKWPRLSENANQYSLVAPAKKVQLSLTGSSLRAFQWASDEHRTLLLSPQRALKNAKRPFSVWNRASLEENLLRSFFVWKPSYQCNKLIVIQV